MVPGECETDKEEKNDVDSDIADAGNSTPFIQPLKGEGHSGDWIEEEVPFAPDGGYGWVVVLASLLNNFVLDGVAFSYSILAQPIIQASNHTFHILNENKKLGSHIDVEEGSPLSEFQFHLCGSVMLGTTLIIGPLVSILSKVIGLRLVSISGSFIAGLGFLISYLGSTSTPSFPALLGGFGILGGIGFGLMFTSSIIILELFFDLNLPLATGIATTGSAVGSVAFPKILEYTTWWWGWSGSLLFISGCCFCSIIFGALYSPPPTTVKRRLKAAPTQTQSMWTQLIILLKSPTMWIVNIAGGVIVLGYFMPSAFLHERAKGSPYYADESEANFLPVGIGISNTLGRIFYGLLANSQRRTYALLLTNVAVTIGGLATIASVYAPNYLCLMIYALIFGQIVAVYASLRSVIIYELVGKERFSLAFGLSLGFMGVALYFGNSLAGYLKDLTGDYDLSFFVTGGCILTSAILCYPLRQIQNWENNRKKTSTVP